MAALHFIAFDIAVAYFILLSRGFKCKTTFKKVIQTHLYLYNVKHLT